MTVSKGCADKRFAYSLAQCAVMPVSLLRNKESQDTSEAWTAEGQLWTQVAGSVSPGLLLHMYVWYITNSYIYKYLYETISTCCVNNKVVTAIAAVVSEGFMRASNKALSVQENSTVFTLLQILNLPDLSKPVPLKMPLCYQQWEKYARNYRI